MAVTLGRRKGETFSFAIHSELYGFAHTLADNLKTPQRARDDNVEKRVVISWDRGVRGETRVYVGEFWGKQARELGESKRTWDAVLIERKQTEKRTHGHSQIGRAHSEYVGTLLNQIRSGEYKSLQEKNDVLSAGCTTASGFPSRIGRGGGNYELYWGSKFDIGEFLAEIASRVTQR